MRINKNLLVYALVQVMVMTVLKETEVSDDDLLLWPDGTTCYRCELSEFGYMSDDYEVIPVDTERYIALTKDL